MPRASRIRCAYAEPVKPKRAPAKKRSEMTEEEREDAEMQSLMRAAFKSAKEEWEKTLGAPWSGPDDFKWSTDTIGIYKSDAKSSFGLTDNDIMTLRHESIAASPKTFYSLVDVKNLSYAKFAANALSLEFGLPGVPKNNRVRIFKKVDHLPNRRVRTNWKDLGNTHWSIYGLVHSKKDPQALKDVSVKV